jgi:hypothetical protein
VEDRERKPVVRAGDEESSQDEDVELHRKKSGQVAANEEMSSEGGPDDDVELHRKVTPS